MVDVTDATFETEVLARSEQVPVVVDLWAEWCGPCRTLGPILESVIGATNGKVALAKIDVDGNPRAAATFQVQSIPAVYALRDRKIVDHFMGALPQAAVEAFVQKLLPTEEETEVQRLLAAGDEQSLRSALELEPADETVVCALAELLVADGRADEALELLARIPETADARRIAALARVGTAGAAAGDPGAELDDLLNRVKDDDDARQRFVDLLEVMGPDDPRTADYRRKLTQRLF